MKRKNGQRRHSTPKRGIAAGTLLLMVLPLLLNLLALDAGAGVASRTVSFTERNDANYGIPNPGQVESPLVVSDSVTMSRVDVSVGIVHGRRGDLTVTVIAPDGTARILFQSPADNTANLYRTFNNVAGMPGRAADGTWTLRVNDGVGNGFNGFIDYWSVRVYYTLSSEITNPVAGSTISGTRLVQVRAVNPAGVRLNVDGAYTADLTYNGATARYEYSLDTTGLGDGTHTLQAVAYDARGNTVADAHSYTVDNWALTVNIVWPTAGSGIAGTTTVWAQVPSYAQSAEIYVDGQMANSFVGAPTNFGGLFYYGLSIVTTGWSDGNHAIRFMAYDPDGNAGAANTAYNFNNYAITITITTPAAGARLTGTATVRATVPAYAVRGELYVDDSVAAVLGAPTGGQYTFSLDTLAFSDGTHNLRVVAYDPDGNTAADSRRVTFDNYAITVTIVSPAGAQPITIRGTIAVSATVPAYATRGELYIDSTPAGVDYTITAGRYDFSLNTNGFPDGQHTLRVVAYDPDGNSAADTRGVNIDNYQSFATAITVSSNPGVGTISVWATAPAYANSARLDVDGVTVAVIAGAPAGGRYTFSLDTRAYADANHLLAAYVGAPDGGVASASMTLPFDNWNIFASFVAPTPAAGSTTSGTITLRANAPTYSTSGEFFIDGVVVGRSNGAVVGGMRQYSLSVDTRAYADGAHTLKVQAYDPDRNFATDSRMVAFDNWRLSVTMVQPLNGATVSGNMLVRAATQTYATRGELYIDGIQAASLTAFTFQAGGFGFYDFTVNTRTLRDGLHTVSVRTYDPDKNTASAQAAINVDNYQISVTITAPADGSLVSGNLQVTAQAPAYAVRGEAYIDSTLAGAVAGAPSGGVYTFPFSSKGFLDGWKTLRVVAYDPDGNTAAATRSLQFDNTPPKVASVSVKYPPGQGAARPGDKITILTTLADDGSGVASATFDGTPLGSGTGSLYDDGAHSDGSSRDGLYGSETVNVTGRMGWKLINITVTDAAGNRGFGSVKVGVDTHAPMILETRVVYPSGQTAAKNNDDVRLLARVIETKNTVDVVLVVDTSGSIAGQPFTDTKNAVKGFIGRLGQFDRAAIYSFDNPRGNGGTKPQRERDFTSDKTALNGTVDNLRADDWTPLYDSVYAAVDYAKTSPNLPVVIVLTDGNDVIGYDARGNEIHSTHPIGDVLNAPVPVFTIGLDPGVGFDPINTTALKAISQSSNGGAYYYSPTSANLNAIYNDLSDIVAQMDVGGVGSVTADLSGIGGQWNAGLYDDGVHGDGAARDDWFGGDMVKVGSSATRNQTLPVTANDIAGNTDTQNATIRLDNTPPVVSNVTPKYPSGKWWASDGDTVYFTAQVSDPGTVYGIALSGSIMLDATAAGAGVVRMNDGGTENDGGVADGVYTSSFLQVASGMGTGFYTVKVTAYDNASNAATAAGTLFVNNDGYPGLFPQYPAEGQFIEGKVSLKFGAYGRKAISRVLVTISPGGTVLKAEYSAATGLFESPLDTTMLADGNYRITADAYDLAGRKANTTMVNFSIDNHAPVLVLVSPREGDILSGTVALNLTGTNDLFMSSVEYAIDGTAWTPAPLPWNTTRWNDGYHTLTVRAQDRAGHTTAVTVTVVVDNGLPAILIVAPVPGQVISGQFLIRVKANDTVGVERVELGGTLVPPGARATFNAGTGYYEYSVDAAKLQDGAYTLSALVTDIAGHVTDTPAAPMAVFVDNTPPDLTAMKPADGGVVSGTLNVTALITDGPFDPVKASWRVDEREWGVLVRENMTSNWSAAWNTSAHPDGKHNITLSAEDIAGRTTQVRLTVTIDNSPPDVKVAYPAPGGYIEGEVTLSATAYDAVGVASVEFFLKGPGASNATKRFLALPTAGGGYQATLKTVTSETPDGAYRLWAEAADRSGLPSRSAEFEVRIDNSPPDISLTSPLPGSLVSGTVAVNGSAADTFLDNRTYSYTVDWTGWRPLTDALNTSLLADGNHSLSIRASDLAGHTTTRTYQLRSDNLPPSVVLVSPADGARVRGTVTAVIQVLDSSDITESVIFFNESSRLTMYHSGAERYQADADLSTMPDGPASVGANFTDAAGHTTVLNFTVTVDNSPPAVELASPVEAVIGKVVRFQFRVSDPSGVQSVHVRYLGGWYEMALSGDNITYSYEQVINDLPEGDYAFDAKVVDRLGNTAIMPYHFSVKEKGKFGAASVALETPMGIYGILLAALGALVVGLIAAKRYRGNRPGAHSGTTGFSEVEEGPTAAPARPVRVEMLASVQPVAPPPAAPQPAPAVQVYAPPPVQPAPIRQVAPPPAAVPAGHAAHSADEFTEIAPPPDYNPAPWLKPTTLMVQPVQPAAQHAHDEGDFTEVAHPAPPPAAHAPAAHDEGDFSEVTEPSGQTAESEGDFSEVEQPAAPPTPRPAMVAQPGKKFGGPVDDILRGL